MTTDERTLSKLRKLAALHSDPATTEGERAGCRAAMERLKYLVTAEAFDQATKDSTEKEFLKRAKERRQRKERGFQRYQEQQRERDFVRDTVNRFARPQAPPAANVFERDTRAMRNAYPSAYGDRK